MTTRAANRSPDASEALADNLPRFRAGRDGVESWFLRANAPDGPRALWLKITTLTRRGESGVAEAWCALFDGDRTHAWRATMPLPAASLGLDGPHHLVLRAAGAHWVLDEHGGRSTGQLADATQTVNWDLTFTRGEGALGDPLCLLPSRQLVDGPLPKSKLLTPFPVLRFSGQLRWGDDEWDLDGMTGMQGHNWGAAHAPEYAWGQCVFFDGHGAPIAVAEGASGCITLGPVTTPLISLLSVRYDGREYRFDRLLELWRQHPRLDFPKWTLRIAGPDGEATLAMQGRPDRMVCLGYDNPREPRRYCLNSKTAAVTLRVNPTERDGFTLESVHGGALEFLLPEPHPAVPDVV